MSASESPPEKQQLDMVNNGAGRSDSITAELLRAKVLQKKRYAMLALALILGGILSVGAIAFSNATVMVVSPVEAHEHAMIAVVDGFGATIGNAVYTLAGHAVIEVSSPGFKSVRKILQADNIGTTIHVAMIALPGHLHIATRPEADNTRWFIDGRMVTVAAVFEQDLTAGKHSIDINSPYYLHKRIPVILERGKTIRLTIALEPVSGHLNIKTNPPGATIRVNGAVAGVSPLNLAKEGGRYQLELSLGDYQPVTETIEITRTNHEIERNHKLKLKNGYVRVYATPTGGELLVDGKAMNPAAMLTLTAGVEHALVYAKQGYFSQHRHITVVVGSERKVSFHLKAELGRVSIVSKPVAAVKLDGKNVGQTPFSMKLSVLPHRLVVHRQSYRSYRRTFTPDSKSTLWISVKLLTERASILAESPRRMTNSAGIEMKQFRPHCVFVMGAPRSEIGQRANEFLRKVRLTKPIYISTHEVSRAQYSRFRHVAGAGDEPVTSVSWLDAARFCNWLSLREKLTPFYNIRNSQLRGFNAASDGYRLPSEAEWEWLARKAGKTKQSRFTWGDATTIPDKSGNISDESAKGITTHYVPNYSDGYAGVAPIGSYPAEPSGLYDLSGNVSEWVHDVYSLVPPVGQKTELDPLGQNRGDTHTVKGSNWRSGTITELRASYRDGANTGRDDIGFRVARYID